MNSRATCLAAALGHSDLEVMARHARSFRWAGALLPRWQLDRVATLYRFCRQVDDAVDKAANPEAARREIDLCREALAGGRDRRGDFGGFLQLARESGIEPEWTRHLIDGVERDNGPVRIDSVDELIRYCFQVAGVVGLMMCRVLNVADKRAHPFAIDLGVAMQLTNIARDVLEDAEMDRLYVPRELLEASVEPRDLCRGARGKRVQVERAVTRLLSLAGKYFRSAEAGIGYLPYRSRFAILTAGRVYGEIGVRIQKKPSRIWSERTVVGRFGKLRTTFRAAWDMATDRALRAPNRGPRHNWRLHRALRGFPGTYSRQ